MPKVELRPKTRRIIRAVREFERFSATNPDKNIVRPSSGAQIWNILIWQNLFTNFVKVAFSPREAYSITLSPYTLFSALAPRIDGP